MAVRRRYTARFVRDVGGSGWWVITVPGVKGCVTQADTLAHGLERIREALSLFVEGAARAEIVPQVVLPRTVAAKLERARRERERAAAAQATAARYARAAVVELTERGGLTRRDAAAVLGISHQRVQQLLEEAAR